MCPIRPLEGIGAHMGQPVRKSSAVDALAPSAGEFTDKTAKEFQELVQKLQDMPTLPVIAMRVNELIADPNSTSKDIAEVLKQDQVLTAKVLRLVNSSYYAIPGGVSDVQRALAFLGFNTVAQLVLSLSVFSMFTVFGAEDLTMKDFWMHALATAIAAEALAKKYNLCKPEEAFTCGLLHDIGKLVLHEIDYPRLERIVRLARERKSSFLDVERAEDFLSHAYIGEMMAARWGLPAVVRQAIRYHHHDVSAMDTILPSAKKTIQTVRLANQIAVRNKYGKSGDYSEGRIPPDMLAPLSLTEEDVRGLEKDLVQHMDKAGAFLNASG